MESLHIEKIIVAILGVFSTFLTAVTVYLINIVSQQNKQHKEINDKNAEAIKQLTDNHTLNLKEINNGHTEAIKDINNKYNDTIQYYIEEGEEREKNFMAILEKNVAVLTSLSMEVKNVKEKVCIYFERGRNYDTQRREPKEERKDHRTISPDG